MAILNPNKDCFLNKFELVNYFDKMLIFMETFNFI